MPATHTYVPTELCPLAYGCVVYGRPTWASHSVWIVPGTVRE